MLRHNKNQCLPVLGQRKYRLVACSITVCSSTTYSSCFSATSEAVIFLFLGIVVVSDAHIWNTGFILWTLVACFFCRFLIVYILTAIANMFRTKRIDLKEQVILGYGGLRGAIAFSLVQTIDEAAIGAKDLFVTATLMVILFTVFVQVKNRSVIYVILVI